MYKLINLVAILLWTFWIIVGTAPKKAFALINQFETLAVNIEYDSSLLIHPIMSMIYYPAMCINLLKFETSQEHQVILEKNEYNSTCADYFYKSSKLFNNGLNDSSISI